MILVILSTVFALFVLYLHFRFKSKFNDVLAGIPHGDYPLSDIYYIGFGFMELIHFDMNGKNARGKIKLISEIYGKQYGPYYFYLLRGGQITFGIVLTLLMFMITGISGNFKLVIVGIAVSALMIWYLDELLNDKINARRDELLRDYPGMLSKLTLLVNAGMPIREAWIKVANTNEGILYQEMKNTAMELYNGMQEAEAYKTFGERCSIKSLRKFSTMMIQNLQKGSNEVVQFLKDMSTEAWEEKKHEVKRKGEKASNKLLLPIGLIFAGVLILIIVPMFGSLKF